MQITKYKKLSGDKYKVFIGENLSIILHQDIILKYNLLTNKYIDNDLLKKIIEDNKEYDAYDICLKHIESKQRSKNEICDYLKKKSYNQDVIERTIEKLISNNFINNDIYIKSYINDKFYINKIGPNKIKKDLLKNGFQEYKIDKKLNNIPKKDILDYLDIAIDKRIKQIKNYSGNVLKQKIIMYFMEKGYAREDINIILSHKDLNKKDINEEYEKLFNKYKNKYTGKELENIIKQKLYQKGFYMNE